MIGSTWANHDHDVLLQMAGTDAASLVLLSALFDNAVNEDDIDVKNLRGFCAESSDRVSDESLNFLLVTFPERIRLWMNETDEAEVQRLWHQTLAALFTLRFAAVPCGLCVDVKWNVGQQIGAAEHGPYCRGCRATLASIPRGRTQLRVAS